MPKSLLLFEQEWSVQVGDAGDADGVCQPNKCNITVGDHVCEAGRGEVFCHELIHALLSLTGFGERVKPGIEEDLCRCLGPALFAALRRNKMRFDQ